GAKAHPQGREVAVTVLFQRFRPPKPTFGSSDEVGRHYERQEIWVYACDVERKTVRKWAVVPLPWTAKSEADAFIRGWDEDTLYMDVSGYRRHGYDSPRLHASMRIDPGGRVSRVESVPARARSVQRTGKDFLVASSVGNDVHVRTEANAVDQVYFRLDTALRALVVVGPTKEP